MLHRAKRIQDAHKAVEETTAEHIRVCATSFTTQEDVNEAQERMNAARWNASRLEMAFIDFYGEETLNTFTDLFIES